MAIKNQPKTVKAIITRQAQLANPDGSLRWAQPGEVVTIEDVLYRDLASGQKARLASDPEEKEEGEKEAAAQNASTEARIEAKSTAPSSKPTQKEGK